MARKFILTMIFIGFSQGAFGAQLIKVDEALKKIYGKAAGFERSVITLSAEQVRQIEDQARIHFPGAHSSKLIMYKAFEDGLLIGSAFEDTVIGKWGPIHYLAGLDTQGQVLKVIVLDYEEIRGKPIAKRRFLKQYRGKGIADPLKLRKDIDGVTGATISSRSITSGIRKIIHIFSMIE